jgi:hypothetical protein
MLSCQQTQNVIDGKKRIILNPTEGQRKDFESVTFAEGEVYGIDILISSDDGKVKVISSFQFFFQLAFLFVTTRRYRHDWKNRERLSISATTRYRTSSR